MSRLLIVFIVVFIVFSFLPRCASHSPIHQVTPTGASPQDDVQAHVEENSKESEINECSDKPHETNEECRDNRMLTEEMISMRQELRKLSEQFRNLDLETKKYISDSQKERCSGASCPVGAVKSDCLCLLYVLHERRTWLEARDYCKSMGGNLVIVDSERVTKKIRSFLDTNIGKKARRRLQFWTSLILTVEGIPEPAHINLFQTTRAQGFYWHTFNGTKLLDYTNWLKEPAGINEGGVGMPSCVAMKGGDNLKWEAKRCLEKKYFVCEFRLKPTRKHRSNERRQKRDSSGTACENG